MRGEMKTKAKLRVSKRRALVALLFLFGVLPAAFWFALYVSNPSGGPDSARASYATLIVLVGCGVTYGGGGYLYWRERRKA